MDWTPIADRQIDSKIRRIIHAVKKECEPLDLSSARNAPEDSVLNYSLAGGSPGVALLFLELEQYDQFRCQDALEHYLRLCQSAVSDFEMHPSLYGGFCGIAWLLQFATKRENVRLSGALAAATERLCRQIDTLLIDFLSANSQPLPFDLIDGLVGYGLYALERSRNESADQLLGLIVEQLDRLATRSDAGIAWFTPPEFLPGSFRQLYPDGYYNLGLAHGTPGVVAFLSRLTHLGHLRQRVTAMIRSALDWLILQRLSGQSSAFPKLLAPGREADEARLAWCYGDAGVSAAMLSGAYFLGDKRYIDQALDIAFESTYRGRDEAGVHDASLCHGTAGLLHIYNRLYQATGISRFLVCARYWLAQTIDLFQAHDQARTFATFTAAPAPEPQWEYHAGFLDGASGVALALLACISDTAPRWDHVLLINIEQRP